MRDAGQRGDAGRPGNTGGSVPQLTSFKAYDVRGRVPDEVNEDMAYWSGRALAQLIKPKRVAVGRDMRLSGESLAAAIARGLNEAGVDVVDIGEVGTEQLYFATFALELDGGVMVTASHNPADYNGMKFVREKAIPISGDTGLQQMSEWVARALQGEGPLLEQPALGAGLTERKDIMEEYLQHLLSYVDLPRLRPLEIVANGGDGMAGPVVKRLEALLPFKITGLYLEPDGTFPRGVPNPLLIEKREATAAATRQAGADMGLAWDGDFDRCFFFDETGVFIEGYYLVGLLAQQALRGNPGGRIVHDPRLVWNTIELVREVGGVPVMNKSGHAFIKERMRQEDAVYGGEMSAHHYFRAFSYCDSGMIPWLLVAQLLSDTGKRLSELVNARIACFPVSGEINLELSDPTAALGRLRAALAPDALSLNEIDGVSLEFPDWRVNVRMSNTEPLVRVNVEARGDVELMRRKTQEVMRILEESREGPALTGEAGTGGGASVSGGACA